MKSHVLLSLSALSAIGGACGFVPAQAPNTVASSKNKSSRSDGSSSLVRESETGSTLGSISPRTALFSEKKNKAPFEESMRNKLVAESIAPWRTLRLFLYGSFGSGAFIGGLINGSGAIANSNSPDFSIQTEVRYGKCDPKMKRWCKDTCEVVSYSRATTDLGPWKTVFNRCLLHELIGPKVVTFHSHTYNFSPNRKLYSFYNINC